MKKIRKKTLILLAVFAGGILFFLLSIPYLPFFSQTAKIESSFLWCFFLTPTGMFLLTKFGYSQSFVASIGVPLGVLATIVCWLVSQPLFSVLGQKILDSRKWANDQGIIPSIVNSKSQKRSHRMPYASVAFSCISDVWIALVIARANDLNRFYTLGIICGVSIVRNLFFAGFLAGLEAISPLTLHYLQPASLVGGFVYLGVMTFKRCRRPKTIG